MDQFAVIWSAAQCGFDGWNEIWGDPWLSGTLLVLGYGITGFLLLKTATRLNGRERVLWTLGGAIMVFQAFNTPLDLHAFVWTFGKCLAKAQGWYEIKRQVQSGVFIGLLSVAVILILSCAVLFRRNIVGNLVLIIGIAISTGFTGVKGISLHGLAEYYSRPLGPFFVADWIELGGICLAFLAVMGRRWKMRKQPANT
ncbi:MAG: hypothetical protein AAGA08_13445 [Pseudomonadota bacterium]